MRLLDKDRPTPLPVQALDHATGYIMAAAVIRGLTHRCTTSSRFEARSSLARTAELLTSGAVGWRASTLAAAGDEDWSVALEPTGFGPVIDCAGR